MEQLLRPWVLIKIGFFFTIGSMVATIVGGIVVKILSAMFGPIEMEDKEP